MEADKRACFAVMAATLVNEVQYSGVYDYSQSKHIAVTCFNVESSTPNFYDHNRGGTVSGDEQGMYYHSTSLHVSINKQGNSVNCYDYESSSSIISQ